MRRIGLRTVFLLGALGIGSLPGVFAQVTTATISGILRDESGAVLPAARVTIRHVQTGTARIVTTDPGGRYRAPQLALGAYEIQSELSGFKTDVRRGIELTVGREVVVDFVLQVGDVTEQVTVTAEAPVLETTSSAVSNLVDEKKMRDLPLNARSLEQFVFLMPTAMAFRHYSGTLNIGFAPKISVAGLRTDQNVFLLDGTDINDYAGTTPGSSAGTMAGVETIQEYQVLTHNFSAEYGRSTGAVVNMVTRSGSNEFHGSVFEFLRNDVLDARNFFDRGTPPPFRRNQFGGVLGGPIVRDRTFFMGSYEALRERLGVTNTSFVPDENARQGILPDPQRPGQTFQAGVNPLVRPYLELYPRPNGRNVGGGVAEFIWSFSNQTDEDYWMTRVDHRLSSNHSLFGRYTFDDTRVVHPLTFPFFLDLLNSRNQYMTIAETAVLSPKAVNDFRVAFNRTAPTNDSPSTIKTDPSLDFIPGEGPGVISFSSSVIQTAGGIGALTLIGPSTRTPGHWIRNIYQVLDNFNYAVGNHSIKLGGNFERLQTNNRQPSNRAGAYSFGSLLDFLQARPNQFQASWGAFSGWRQSLIGMYIQDDYKPTPNLTLNLGIRYEFTNKVKEVIGQVRNLDDRLDPEVHIRDSFWKENPSLRAVAPRFGLAWQAFPKTVIRLGIGMYHHQLLDRPLIFLTQQFSRADRGSVTLTSPPFSRVQIQFIPTAALSAVSVQTFQIPTAIHYSFNVQRELGPSTNFTIGYIGTRGYHTLHFAEGNSAFPVILPDGRKFFPAGVPRRNLNFGAVTLIATDSTSDYHGLTLSLQRKLVRGLQFQGSYTFSKALDEGSSTATADSLNEPQSRQDPDDRKLDRGLAAVDVRHNFVVNFTAALPLGPGGLLGGNTSGILGKLLGGWQLNGIATVQSGTPFTPTLPFNRSLNQDRRSSDRPNVKPGVKKLPILGKAERYFDPTAFELQPAGFFGNAARNLVVGPGLVNFDFALVKNTSLSERFNLQSRFEAFNLFNRTNFGLPNGGIFDSNGNLLGSAGRIVRTSTNSRQLQFALKLTF